MPKVQHSKFDPELIKEIKRLNFSTKRLASAALMGSYRSAFRGKGIEFEEVREYQPGDEIRSIDWKVTARTGRPFVKSYREERDLTVMIAVDVSASTLTGTKGDLRGNLIAKIGAALTYIALNNRDKIGLLTFADEVKSFFPPKKNRSAVWRILHEVLSAKKNHEGTDIAGATSFLSGALKGRCVIFVISDFKSPDFKKELSILSKRHDVTAIRIVDDSDLNLKGSGILRVRDPESKQTYLLDLSNKNYKAKFSKVAKRENKELRNIFAKRNVDLLEINSSSSFIEPLKKFFLAKQSKNSVHTIVENPLAELN